MIWKVRNRNLDCAGTLVMGVLNLTPDSFSDGGKYPTPGAGAEQALRLVEEGADILDIGGESTRPGAQEISGEEEIKRLLPVLKEIRKKIKTPVSVDTTKPAVARACLEEGADIINDVSGLKDSGPEMAEGVRQYGAGLVLMHRRGNPGNMQQLARYEDVVRDVFGELKASVEMAIGAGIRREQLAIDPGIGFSKTAEQNLEIIKNLERFHDFGLPILLGHSRKSFIGEITGREIHDREFGTAAISAIAVLKGVQILRVHDVRATRDAVRMAEKIRGDHYVRTF